MASDSVIKAIEDLNRTLKEISSTLKAQNALIKTLSHNYLEINKTSDDVILPPYKENEPVIVPPVDEPAPIAIKTYGWSMAALVQREDGLEKGDVKVEQDDSRWIWTGEAWERVELPSGET